MMAKYYKNLSKNYEISELKDIKTYFKNKINSLKSTNPDKNLNKNKKEQKNSPIKFLDEIKVALISDQFTYDSFKYEFEIIEISPENWFEEFERGKPDLFFCESTWHGYCNGKNGVWSGKIEKYDGETENREILFEILNYCKENTIPTIFWNKEDPVYYRKNGEFFTDTASRFDYLFTSAKEVIDDYKKDFKLKNVFPLMFAGQPKIFNPMKINNEEISDVVFAGSYYKHHKDRAKKMDLIFDKIISQNINLKIYDRTYFDDIPHIGYPEKYKKYTNPPIDYEDTANVYKKYKWAININTITESDTMFARRVFELALSNTNIISNYSKGMKRLFGDNIFIIEEDNFPQLTEDYTDKRSNNLYNVLENHTYTERWKYILDTINFPYKEKINDISIVFDLNSIELNEAIEKFEKIDYNYKKLVLISDSELDLNKDDILVYNNINEFLNNISTEYYIIANNELDSVFVKKAILHFKYLNKNYGIKQDENKFIIDSVNSYINILFNKKINNLNIEYFDVYYI